MATTLPSFLRIECTPLERVDYVFLSFDGSECVSRPFEYTLTLRLGRSTLDPAAVVEQDICVHFSHQALPAQTRTWRSIVGIVATCELLTTSDGMLDLRLRIVPRLARLAYRRNCCVFKEASVPDIVEEVLKRSGLSSGSDFQFHLKGYHRVRPYCVQYDETDLDFLSRLLEEEGIFYYFEHEGKRCTMHLTDTVQTCEYIPSFETIRFEAAIRSDPHRMVWQLPVLERQCHRFAWSERHLPARVAVGNYNHHTAQVVASTASLSRGVTINGASFYHAPPNLETREVADQTANIRAEGWEALTSIISGESTVRALTAGYVVDLADHDISAFNQAYFLTEVHHHCTQTEYWNEFRAQPKQHPYRPPQRTPKPQIHGYLVGRVVGPPSSNDEIYTNEHGWVNILFPWSNPGNKDDANSIFVPVAQLWAGNGYGTMFIPRVGMEAVVAFLDGDPDRPIVIGTIFNPAEPTPYTQPSKKDVSTILTRSTPNGSAGNELRFTDTKNSEEIYLHAQKDWNTLVENDRATTINHDETLTIKNKRTLTVDSDNSETYNANTTVEVKKDYTLTVDGNLKIVVRGDISIETNKNLTIKSLQNSAVEATANLTLKGTAGVDINGLNVNVTAQSALKQSGTAQAELSSAGQTAVRGSIVMIN